MVEHRIKKRFLVSLDPEEYQLLNELTEMLDMKKTEVVRLALRHYFGYAITSLYAPEMKRFFDVVREREYAKKPPSRSV